MNKEILIGKSLKEAQEMLRNCVSRISCVDGEHNMLTADFNMNRYNLFILNGIISDVTFG